MTRLRASTRAKRGALLEVVRKCGLIAPACRSVGVTRRTVYNWLADPAYRAQFEDARQECIERLEAETVRRARDGVVRVKYHNGQPIIDPRTGKPFTERVYSDRLLIFLLRALRPEKYRDKAPAPAPDVKGRLIRLVAVDDKGQPIGEREAAL